MDRRSFLKTLGAGTAALAFPSCVTPSGKSRRGRPNIVFILVDDLGWRDLACTGSTFYETPNIDRLAREGMRFTTAYASCPVCSPTRASLMTGKYPPRVNITDWIPGNRPKNRKLLGPPIADHLALKEVTIAEALGEAGYVTFFAGKWHLGGKGYYPEDQGFDTNIGGCEWGSPHGGYYSPYKNPHMKDGPKGEYLTDRLTRECLKFLDRVGGKRPFFLDLSFYAVHTPIQGCRRYVSHFRKKAAALPPLKGPAQIPEHQGHTKVRQDNPRYASMIRAVDEGVGRILDKLKELGLEKDTVVIFTSDNGGLSTLWRRGFPTSNLPLRAGKGWAYEGGIRVPLIIKAPGVTRPGTTSPVPVISMDLYPTILRLAGLPLRPGQHKDGLDLTPVLKGAKSLPRKALFWHYPHYHGSSWTPGAAIRAGRWKYIEFYDWGTRELYDLEKDQGERHNLAGEYPEKMRELRAMLHAWQKEVGAEMPRPNPNYKPRKGR